MALENAEKFEKLLREDEALQAEFASAVEAHGGEKTDEAMFEAIIAPIAARVGLPFSYEEARELALGNDEPDDSELDSLAGGLSICIIIGGGSEPEANSYYGETGGACAYIGVTLAKWD